MSSRYAQGRPSDARTATRDIWDLFEQWAKLSYQQQGLTLNRAAYQMGVAAETLADAIREVQAKRTNTDPWLVAHALRLRADALDIDGEPELAAKMRGRADEIDAEARTRPQRRPASVAAHPIPRGGPMSTTSETHLCPGCPIGEQAQVPNSQLACRRDWYRLPNPVRTAVWDSYKRHGQGSDQHLHALNVAYDWYRDNPRPAQQKGSMP